ncbi:hypothetical protein TRIUR3_21921 [Triticum urartu]|uniref:Uncharacterized protein n=1 Tax=Triticum urartu TaxID=4572 RepID=M7ZIW4_TRIUA|nr:hypothetical protein TRIUR3_21921 [Triticum urartu]
MGTILMLLFCGYSLGVRSFWQFILSVLYSALPLQLGNLCSDAIMWDQKTGRSRGSGFVSFRNQQNAQTAINELMVHSLLLIASNV